MGVDGCRWVRMSVNECISKGGGKNKAKKAANSRSGHGFGSIHTAGNFSKSAGIVIVD